MQHEKGYIVVLYHDKECLNGMDPPPQRCKVVTYMIYTHRNERTELCGTISRAWLAAGIKKDYCLQTTFKGGYSNVSRDVICRPQDFN